MPLLNETMKANLASFHPFTPKVTKVQLPKKGKWPSIEKYDASSDPKEHIKAYLLFCHHIKV